MAPGKDVSPLPASVTGQDGPPEPQFWWIPFHDGEQWLSQGVSRDLLSLPQEKFEIVNLDVKPGEVLKVKGKIFDDTDR